MKTGRNYKNKTKKRKMMRRREIRTRRWEWKGKSERLGTRRKKEDKKWVIMKKMIRIIPYLRVCKLHFFDKNLPSKIGVRLIHGILCPFAVWAREAVIVCCETPSRDR
jgi:hypothetical protein